MVVRVVFRFLTFTILVLINENKHYNTDNDKRRHRNYHGDPEKFIGQFTMFRSERQIIAVKIRYRIPKEKSEAPNHENDKKSGIHFISSSAPFVPRTLCNSYKI